jgi:NACalpha-BTF3-like transcription factor
MIINIFYENIHVPMFGFISKLKIFWYDGTPCAFIVDSSNINEENLTNPIIKLNLNDILMVIDQAHCSPENAIKALIHNNLDLVNSIMDLTL